MYGWLRTIDMDKTRRFVLYLTQIGWVHQKLQIVQGVWVDVNNHFPTSPQLKTQNEIQKMRFHNMPK